MMKMGGTAHMTCKCSAFLMPGCLVTHPRALLLRSSPGRWGAEPREVIDNIEDGAEGDDDADDGWADEQDDERSGGRGLAAFEDPEATMIDCLDYEQVAVPPTLEVEDAMSQEELTTGISRMTTSSAESRRQYNSIPVNTVYLSQLYHWHSTNNTRAAIRLLKSKNRLKIDSAYTIPSNDPNLAWERPEVSVRSFHARLSPLTLYCMKVRLDYKQMVAAESGIAMVLPNLNVRGAAHDPHWRFTLRPDRRFWDFRGDRLPIGFDIEDKIAYFGLTNSGDHVWLVVSPMEHFGKPIPAGFKPSNEYARMSARDVRILMVMISWMLMKSRFGAHIISPPYPDVDNEDKVGDATAIL